MCTPHSDQDRTRSGMQQPVAAPARLAVTLLLATNNINATAAYALLAAHPTLQRGGGRITLRQNSNPTQARSIS